MVELIKNIMRDGIVSAEEEQDYDEAVETLKTIMGKMLSVIVYHQNTTGKGLTL